MLTVCVPLVDELELGLLLRDCVVLGVDVDESVEKDEPDALSVAACEAVPDSLPP